MKSFRVTPKYISASYTYDSIEKDGNQYIVRDEFDNVVETFIDLEDAKSWVEIQNPSVKEAHVEPEVNKYEFILPNEHKLSLCVYAQSKQEAKAKMYAMAKDKRYNSNGAYLVDQ
jgi:hypothetical protein